jgi:hypothetical protein
MVKIDKYDYEISDRKDKKLKVYVNDKWIHFGQTNYQHFNDRTGLLPKSESHHDEDRRRLYLARATHIRDKEGKLTKNDPNSSNWHALRILWNY